MKNMAAAMQKVVSGGRSKSSPVKQKIDDSEMYHTMLREMTRLQAHNLQRAPYAEDLPYCAGVVAAALLETGVSDYAAVEASIRQLGRQVDTWPTTHQIITSVQDEIRQKRMRLPPPEMQYRERSPACERMVHAAIERLKLPTPKKRCSHG